MRVLLAAIECQKGDIDGNLAVHLALLDRAIEEQHDLVVFPELSLTGSIDPRARPDRALTLDHPAVQALALATRRNVAVLFGIAEALSDDGGRGGTGPDGAIAITQVYAYGGKIRGVQRKRHLGEGEEAFTVGPLAETPVFELGSARIGTIICAESTVEHTWDETGAHDPHVIAFCSAPGLYPPRNLTTEGWRASFEWWESAGLADAQTHARRLGVWVVMTTQAGATHDEDFPGLAAVIDPSGTIVARTPDWRPSVLSAELPIPTDVEPLRISIRVLVVDDRGATLLCEFRSPDSGHSWWVPPGGGVEPGETDLDCARRELYEELGRTDLEIGPPIGVRNGGTFVFREKWVTQHERWHLARCVRFDVADSHVATLSGEGIHVMRWWTADELRAEGVETAPRNLADLLDRVNAGDLPSPDEPLPF